VKVRRGAAVTFPPILCSNLPRHSAWASSACRQKRKLVSNRERQANAQPGAARHGLSQALCTDPPGLIDELVPRHTAVVDEIVVRFEDAVRQPVVTQELPDVFDRIELGTFRRQRHNGDVWWHDESRRQVPAGLIDQEYGVCAGRDGGGDLHQVQVHRLGVAGRQDQGCTLTLFRADGAEDVGGSGALVAGRTWARAALRPSAGDLVLLADTSLICEPDFYRVDADRLLTRDCVQARGEAFLKSSIAPAACA
jgi:hypothetical protein